MNEFYRGRRLRRNPVIREMVRETQLSAADLMMLYFVVDTTDEDFKKEIPSMPGQYQLSLKQLEKTVGEAVDAGLRSLMLFGIPKHKDAIASEAYAPNGIVQRAIRMLKAKWPDLQVVTDVCLCEYTSHGHCGILKEGDTCGEVVNDPTLELLAKTALSHVEAGADMVAPSDMMDGRILAIRETLDKAGYVNTPIMSYAVKYASAFYGPFRDAAESAPHHGDRKTYQMDPANAMEGLREAAADIDEAEREAQLFEVLDDDVDLVAHVLEDMQLADLRSDVQVQSDDVDVFERPDLRGVLKHFLVGDAELAVRLARVDAVVGLGVDVGVDAQRDVGHLARLGRKGVDQLQFLNRLAVDGQNVLLDGVFQLLVAFAHARIDDALGVESGLDGLAQLVARGAVDAQPVFADDRQQVVVVVGLDGVVHLVTVFFRLVDDAFEGLAQQRHVIEVERGLVAPEFGCDLSA